jgi:hypothetical protein
MRNETKYTKIRNETKYTKMRNATKYTKMQNETKIYFIEGAPYIKEDSTWHNGR